MNSESIARALAGVNTRASAPKYGCGPSGGHERCPEQDSFGVVVAAKTRRLELESGLT